MCNTEMLADESIQMLGGGSLLKYNECPDVTWNLIAVPPPGRVVFSTLVS